MPPEQFNWAPPPAGWSPNWLSDQAAHNIHVWGISLVPPAKVLETLARILAPAELDRAARFHFARDRNRFLAGRGFLRVILGRYLKADPGQLEFIYGRSGKPVLGGFFAATGLHFNLAHSGEIGLLALSPLGPVGVDVEMIRPLNDLDDLVDSILSPRESAVFRAMPESAKPLAFFKLWTRKEAFLKATGEGISRLLHPIEVSIQSQEPAQLLNLPSELGPIDRWHLNDLSPAPGFVAALATPVQADAIVCSSWEIESL